LALAAEVSALLCISMEPLEEEPATFGKLVYFNESTFTFHYIEANGPTPDTPPKSSSTTARPSSEFRPAEYVS
jgi:hypothetical protein